MSNGFGKLNTEIPATAAPTVPMGHLLLRVAKEQPNAEALVVGSERVTYGELASRSWEMAKSFAGLGVRPGQHVGVLMPNSVNFVIALFGASLIGAVVVPINTRYRSTELRFILVDAQLTTVVISDIKSEVRDLAELLTGCLPELTTSQDVMALELAGVPALRSVVCLSNIAAAGTIDKDTFISLADEADIDDVVRTCGHVSVNDIAMLIYTSGTTANPRGAMIKHEALVRSWSEAGYRWEIGPEDTFWDPCPLFHLAGLGPLLFTLGAGARFLTDTYFDAERAVRQIVEEQATLLYPVYPPITTALLNHPNFLVDELSAVRAWLNVAPPETLRKYQEAIPHAIHLTLYGMTEAGVISMQDIRDDEELRVESCGRPLPGIEIDVVQPGTSRSLGTSAPGEIVLRGYNCFSGYFNDPERTQRDTDSDGWFHTGDLGTIGSQGDVMFLGRLKEMLKVGGENVAPAEIESQLGGYPGVKLVQAVGVPDERLGEVPAAFVELIPGAKATEEDLINWCRERIASFKIPRYIRFVDEWPMSATKIQRSRLREELLLELGEVEVDNLNAETGTPLT